MNIYLGTSVRDGSVRLVLILLKPLVCPDDCSVLSDPDDVAPPRTDNDADGVEMKFADNPFVNDIP